MAQIAPDSGKFGVPRQRAGALVAFACALVVALASPAPIRADDLSPTTQDLFAAIQRNDFSAVQLSVADGADISARNKFGMLAVDLAVDKGHFEIAHYLLSLREIGSQTGEPPEEPEKLPEPDLVAEPDLMAEPDLVAEPDLMAEPDSLAETPSPPAPASDWPVGEQNPFAPNAIPGNAGGQIISGEGVAGVPVMGDIIEPPPAAPSQAAETPAPPVPDETAATTPSAQARPVSTKVGQAQSSAAILNRLGNILGLQGQPGDPAGTTAIAPPPAAPGIEEPIAAVVSEAVPEPVTAPEPDINPRLAQEPVIEAPEEISADTAPEPSEVPMATPQSADQTAAVPDEPQPPADKVELTRELNRTVDTYLGGWFVKWLGRKIGVISDASADEEEPPAQEPEQPDTADITITTNSSEVADNPGTSIIEPVAETPIEPSEPPSPAEPLAEPLADAETPPSEADVAALSAPPFDADLEPEIDTGIDIEPDPEPTADAALNTDPGMDTGIENEPEIDVSIDTALDVDAEIDAGADPSMDSQVAEVSDAAADPFAPGAVAPGSAHPVIGDTPIEAPQPPDDTELADADLGDVLEADPEPDAPALEDNGEISDIGEIDGGEIDGGEIDGGEIDGGEGENTELDALAEDLGMDEAEPDATPDPGENPQVAETNGRKSDLMGQLSNFLEADDTPLEAEGTDDPELDAEGDSLPGLEELDAAAEEIGVTQTASIPPMVARQIPDKVLTLGESIHLTATKPAPPDDPSEEPYCVEKNSGNTVFCVEQVDWPMDLAEELAVSTIIYQGAQTIVRYDDGSATRFHSIFPSPAFDSLISYYSRRFGEPTEITERTIAPFAQPRETNPIMVWRRDDPLSGELTTLEIRRYDDARGGFPDLKHGVLMLSNASSAPIFPVLSALDLMPTTGTN